LWVEEGGRYRLREASLTVAGTRLEGMDLPESPGEQTMDLQGAVVLPAFRNLHLHLGEGIFAGLPASSLEAYLDSTERFHQQFSREARDSIWADSATWTLGQALMSGTAVAVAPRACEARTRQGMRVISLLPVMNSGKLGRFFSMSTEEVEQWLAGEIEAGCPRGLFLHSPEYVDETWLRRATALRRQRPGLWISAHVAETAESSRRCQEQWGGDAVEIFERHGLLGPRTLLVHGGHLSESALARLAETRTGLVLCPVSNWRLGTPSPSLETLLALGVPVAIGSDGAGTAGTLDLLAQARLCGPLLRTGDPHLLLSLITWRPAQMLGEEPSAGRIVPNGTADLFFLAGDAFLETPCPDPAEALLWGPPPEPSGLMVGGEMVWARPPLQGPPAPALAEVAARLRRYRLMGMGN
jgi:cytosine/adenosine deaminase-related metal-dependent hydrolase